MGWIVVVGGWRGGVGRGGGDVGGDGRGGGGRRGSGSWVNDGNVPPYSNFTSISLH